MPKHTDIQPRQVAVYFLPVRTRLPLKFGSETLTSVTCARVALRVESVRGNSAEGWGETPLSVQWVWPSALGYEERHEALQQFCLALGEAWGAFRVSGHPLEIGRAFLSEALPALLRDFNAERLGKEPMPWLAALVCCSAFDLALHDAYGVLHGVPVFETYNRNYMNQDLSGLLPAMETDQARFSGRYPEEYLVFPRANSMPAWHLVGGKDWLESSEADGTEPEDGYPVLLTDWIERDDLRCLKIKLLGNDSRWDYERLVRVGEIGIGKEVDWLSADFNCTVTDPDYVNAILDKLLWEYPRIYGMILYVEQPFPYELEENQINVHSVSARKPLFMDESAHDWRMVALGRSLGWTGVALKTCKTMTGALLSLCWAKAHGMTLMVQDLTNPMLAQIPHVLLAAHAGTIMGVETNSMQFYPEASAPEAKVHPGIYQRRKGQIHLGTISGPGLGYKLEEIERELPAPILVTSGA
jgi:L-alanine-DL-glutamate epimerase-like enolase superfamily enzyme